MRVLCQRGSCINSISASPRLSRSSLTSCTAPRPSTCTQRQTLFRGSLNSAAPLALYLYTSCTQTLNKVNTQGSTLNTKQWHTQTLSQPSHFQFEYQLQTMFPKSLMALFRFKNSELVAMALFQELPVMKVMFLVPSIAPIGRNHHRCTRLFTI